MNIYHLSDFLRIVSAIYLLRMASASTVMQSHKAATAHFSSKQLLQLFGFARQSTPHYDILRFQISRDESTSRKMAATCPTRVRPKWCINYRHLTMVESGCLDITTGEQWRGLRRFLGFANQNGDFPVYAKCWFSFGSMLCQSQSKSQPALYWLCTGVYTVAASLPVLTVNSGCNSLPIINTSLLSVIVRHKFLRDVSSQLD